MDKVFELVKDTPVQTTPKTRSYMSAAFDAEEWAVRDPMVMRGTTVTSDNYWKGSYDHQNALTMIDTYDCPDPYVTTEMEDVAIAQTLQRLGMLDRLIILRDSVNMDVFIWMFLCSEIHPRVCGRLNRHLILPRMIMLRPLIYSALRWRITSK